VHWGISPALFAFVAAAFVGLSSSRRCQAWLSLGKKQQAGNSLQGSDFSGAGQRRSAPLFGHKERKDHKEARRAINISVHQWPSVVEKTADTRKPFASTLRRDHDLARG